MMMPSIRPQQVTVTQRSRYLYVSCIVILFFFFISFVPQTFAAGGPSRTGRTDPSYQIRMPWVFQRKVQSWLIRQTSQTKSTRRMDSRRRLAGKTSISNASPASVNRGSLWTIHRPTKERVYRWFGIQGEDPNQFVRCMMVRKEYNHNMVGITNPLLHIGRIQSSQPVVTSPKQREEDVNGYVGSSSSHPQLPNYETTLPASRIRSTGEEEKSWWPSLQSIPLNGYGPWNGGTGKERKDQLRRRLGNDKDGDWRILIYRKCVGRGVDCYERVRDAALDWEFQTDDGSLGMVEVPPVCPTGGRGGGGGDWVKTSGNANTPKPQLPIQGGRYTVRPVIEEGTSNADNSCVYRSLGSASRRLVSFASTSIMGIQRRRLYAVNPVMVVYDLIDQRAPGTTFTSTAYATLKGHWLRGEERVTVAMRDGTQDVDVEILSISRAGPTLWGKAIWPFVGTMQTKFFEQHLDHLARTGASATFGHDDDKTTHVASRVDRLCKANANRRQTQRRRCLLPPWMPSDIEVDLQATSFGNTRALDGTLPISPKERSLWNNLARQTCHFP